MQVIVGDAAVPVSATRRAGDVVHGLQPERDRTTGQQRGLEIAGIERDLATAEIIQWHRHARTRPGKNHPLDPVPKRAARQQIGSEGAGIAQRRAQAPFPAQDMAAARSEDMQAKPRMTEQMGLAPAKALRQLARKVAADQFRSRAFTGQAVVALIHIVMRQPGKLGLGLLCIARQAGRRHTPGADRSAEQMHLMAAVCQPVTEDELIQRAEDQPFRPASSGRDQLYILRPQATLGQASQGTRAGEDLQGRLGHRLTTSFPDSLRNRFCRYGSTGCRNHC